MRVSMGAFLCSALSAFSASVLSPAAFAAAANPSVGSPIALTFYVAPAHPKEAEAKAQSLQTPGSPDYHKFLTREQFVHEYAVSDADLKSIEGSLQNLGFTIGYVFPNHLAIEVFGTVSTTESALNIHLKTSVKNGRTSMAPTGKITLPAELQGKIRGVGGLNTLNRPQPMSHALRDDRLSTRTIHHSALTGGSAGNYLPADFAHLYNVDPLYNQGIEGRGTTVGIVTLNDFDPADAYTFWKQIGLKVSQSRITKVDVDGGIESPYNNSDGEGETDLDTEYSGALAPSANLRVYIAPNYTNSFINAFEAAASDNIADVVSTSWGEPEIYYFPEPGYSSETYLLDDFHDVFLEMALQGQTVYASSGDSGSFDTVSSCPVFGTPTPDDYTCSAPYAVDHPSSDPLVTSAGGTTLPFFFAFRNGFDLYNVRQRAWSWDYIVAEGLEQGFAEDYPLEDFFSVGGGGGVSAYFPLPWYQASTSGITKTKPHQQLTEDFGSGPTTVVEIPSNFAGRNLPDVSANADPETGYQYISEGYVLNFYGGTSFVAPQLAGVGALYIEGLGQRIGQLNPALYILQSPDSKQLSLGDNWGYTAKLGYDNASGLGTLDGDRLFKGLKQLEKVK